MLNNFFTRLLFNEKKEISFMKLGGVIGVIALLILYMPTMGFTVPVVVLNVSVFAIAFGVIMCIAGARDAFKK